MTVMYQLLLDLQLFPDGSAGLLASVDAIMKRRNRLPVMLIKMDLHFLRGSFQQPDIELDQRSVIMGLDKGLWKRRVPICRFKSLRPLREDSVIPVQVRQRLAAPLTEILLQLPYFPFLSLLRRYRSAASKPFLRVIWSPQPSYSRGQRCQSRGWSIPCTASSARTPPPARRGIPR